MIETPRRLVLEVCFGPYAGKKTLLRPGEHVRVGRRERAGLVLAMDERLSAVHFELGWDGKVALLKDLESASGTYVLGEQVRERALEDGAFFRAGQTSFLVHHEGRAPSKLSGPPSEYDDDDDGDEATAFREHSRVALENERAFREHIAASLLALSQTSRLYLVLDAARDPAVLSMLHAAAEEYESLYEGKGGDALADVAPYIVELEAGSALIERMVMEAWGERWGIFIVSGMPRKDVRSQLRRFLMVEDGGTGEALYFRFYDPEVLRTFLPTCTLRQATDFWRGIDAILCEDEEKGLARYDREAALSRARAE